MGKFRSFAMPAILVGGILILSGAASAGPILTWLGLGNDPPPSYSPARFWAPGAAKLHDDVHGPKIPVYAPNRHPEIPPTYDILKFPTSIAAPAQMIIVPPTAPATSKAQ